MRSKIPKRTVLIPENAKRVFKGVIFDVYQWEQELFDGTTTTFEMLKRPDTVSVIAVHDDKVVVLEQEQPNHGVFYSIPGGINDHAEEDELQAVKRELLEETGLTFKNWKLLGVMQTHNKIEHYLYTFLATDLDDQVEQVLDAGEKIKVLNVSYDEAKKLLLSENGRYIPKEFEKSNSLDELLQLPEFE